MLLCFLSLSYAAAPDGVLATVDRVPVTVEQLTVAAAAVRTSEDQTFLSATQVAELLDALIGQTLLAEEALALGLDRHRLVLDHVAAAWMHDRTRESPRREATAAKAAYLEGLRQATPPVLVQRVVGELALSRTQPPDHADVRVVARVGAEDLTVADLVPWLADYRRGEGPVLSAAEVEKLVQARADIALIDQDARRAGFLSHPSVRRTLSDLRADQIEDAVPRVERTAVEMEAWVAQHRPEPASPGAALVTLVWIPRSACPTDAEEAAQALADDVRLADGGLQMAIARWPSAGCPIRVEELGWVAGALDRGVAHPDGRRWTFIQEVGEPTRVLDLPGGFGFYVGEDAVLPHDSRGWIHQTERDMRTHDEQVQVQAHIQALRRRAKVVIDRRELEGLQVPGLHPKEAR